MKLHRNQQYIDCVLFFYDEPLPKVTAFFVVLQSKIFNKYQINMKRNLFFIVIVMLLFSNVFAQTEQISKYDKLLSKSGCVIKKASVPVIQKNLAAYGGRDYISLSVKLVKIGTTTYYYLYFYERWDDKFAFIEYNDLVSLISSLPTIRASEQKDITSEIEGIQNRYVTADGFAVGYNIENGYAQWGINLNIFDMSSYYKKSTPDIELSYDEILLILKEGKKKIDELKTKSF